MIRPYEAWTLRRLLVGHTLNGELRAVSEPFRAIANELAAWPPEARQDALDAFLADRDDRDEIVEAVANADPEKPAPEATVEAAPADGWGPIRLPTLPSPRPFPVEVLPEAAARLVREGAHAIGCPRDFLGLPVLAMAGGAIGRSVCLMLKPNYFASTTIFGACIGPPSDGKTPALKMVAGAIRHIDELLQAEHAQALERWKEEQATAQQAGGKKSPPPPKPKARRIDVDDITMEAIPIILAENPRGLVMIRDELTALVLGMNQFKGGKGNDRSIALKIWSGDAIKKDRVTDEDNVPVRCPHPALSIIGGLPPDMLGELLDPKGRADGFVDRFLLAYPDPLPVPLWSENGLPEDVSDDWISLVARLWIRPLNVKDGRQVPHIAHFSPESKECWTAHYNEHSLEMNGPDLPPTMRGPWGKLREYAGRLTLILACLEHAADPTADAAAVPNIDARIVGNAWTLIDYFKANALRVHAAIAQGRGIGGGPVVKAVVDWLREGQRRSFSERDIKQARRWITDETLPEALGFLCERNVIRAHPASERPTKGGRPHSPVYDVNPALLDSQNPQDTRNHDRTGGNAPRFEGFEGFENE